MQEKDIVFYPQDEMTTTLIPVTTGCLYNKCTFCSMYKDIPYSEISFKEIEVQLINGDKYTERIFLTGADPMSIGFEKMDKLLDMIRKHLPYCACVASYASIWSLSNYSVDQLSILHDKGLRTLYIGFESGDDQVLRMVKKAHTADEAIKEAKKLNEAKIPFNTIIMYGIAGKDRSEANASLTAKMINQFKTTRVITMSLTIFGGTEMYDMVQSGDFVPADGKEQVEEIKTLLENINPKDPTIFDTTHPTNIISIKGTLPQDREKLLAELAKYIG